MENLSVYCPELIGFSAVMTELREVIAKVAPSRATALIEGESGTGKELVARAIHCQSKRAAGPFVAVNCAALPESLLESELFGHERGAFTGADTVRRGEFELAEGGTLFLDETPDLPLAVQAKLLRALQQREIKRIGGETVIPVDIRVLAATSRDLRTAQFRPELYYRLRGVSVQVPALRHRREDVLLLARHFIEKIAPETAREVLGISPEAEAALVRYHWPGNVRQLEGMILEAMVLGSSPTLQLDDFPVELSTAARLPTKYAEALRAAKREIVGRALAETGDDYRQAAELLGLYPTSLLRLIRTLGLRG